MIKTLRLSNTAIFALIASCVALGNAGSTLYLSALVQIGQDLHASDSMMKLTLSCYLVSFGVSQLFYGPLSDSFGRRIILLIGLSIFFIGSILSAFADNISILYAGRLIEGIGLGSANAVGFALVRDIYSGKALARQFSYLSVFVGLTPIIAPLIGGYLVEFINWRACFIVLALISLTLVILKYFFLPETNQHPDPNAYQPKVALKNYFTLLKNPIFLGFALSGSVSFSSLLCLNGMLPFLLINQLHISPSSYGWFTIITGSGYLSGAFVGGRLAGSRSIFHVVLIGIFITLATSALGYLLGLHYFNLYVIIIPLMLTLFGLGFILPMSSGGALAPFPTMAGSAAALLGCSQFFIASIFTAISSQLKEETQLPLFGFLFVLGCLTLLVIQIYRINSKTIGEKEI